MKVTTKIIKQEIYEFDEKERLLVIKRVLKNNLSPSHYWNYDDCLGEEQIMRVLLEEDGLSDVEMEIRENNSFYIDEQISEIIINELNEKELSDSDLVDLVREELQNRFDINLKDLIKNSRIRLRAELNTNEDFGYIPEMREEKGDYYKSIRKVFKNSISKDDLNTEINNFIGSDYGKLVFFFEVRGENILKLREQLQKGYIIIPKNVGCGLFNSWSGCGSDLEINLIEDVKLKLDNWVKNKKPYYNVSVMRDSNRYGIQETYGLVGTAWRELE